MILINKKQIDLASLSQALGITIPLDKIKKKPLFEINPALIFKDPANGVGATKHRNSMEFPCYFQALLKDGTSVEIRYCTNRTPDAKFMGQTEKFSPRMVEFDGKAEFIQDDLDKAVYYWLHFFNKTSPFRKDGLPYEYELVDDQGRANELIANITLRSKATAHAAALSGSELIITAKGMKIAGANSLDELSIKAQLMQFASDKPAEYLNKAQSQVNHIEGLIRDSIDKGIFVLENVFNSKRWKWAMGVKKGEIIVEMSSSVSDDDQALITHIAQNIQEFLPVLIDTAKTTNAKTNLEKAVADINVFDLLKSKPAASPVTNEQQQDVIIPPAIINSQEQSQEEDSTDDQIEDDTDPLPTSYKDAQEYLGVKIGKKTPGLAKLLNDGVAGGTITKANIEEHLAFYREQSK